MASRDIFRFEKWYFDVALPAGEVVFFFLAKTRILNWTDRRLSLTVTSPGAKPIHRTLILRESDNEPSSLPEPPLPGFPEISSGSESGIHVHKSGDDFSIDVTFDRHQEARPPSKPMVIRRGKKRILWEPVQSRSLVQGSVQLGKQMLNAERCDGYVDHLVSDLFPLFAPVRTLYWGRFHHPEGTLNYTVIPGARPHALLTWSSRPGQLEFDSVDFSEREAKISSLLHIAYPSAYTLTAKNPSSRIRLDVLNTEPAVEAEFIGSEEIPGGIKRRALNILARNPRSIKFFSRGDILVEGKTETVEIKNGSFFSEIVRFA